MQAITTQEDHTMDPATITQVPCEQCGSDTMPPYTSRAGTYFPGYYCEACGWTTKRRD